MGVFDFTDFLKTSNTLIISLWSQTVSAKVYASKGKQPSLINKGFNVCLIYKNFKSKDKLKVGLEAAIFL